MGAARMWLTSPAASLPTKFFFEFVASGPLLVPLP